MRSGRSPAALLPNDFIATAGQTRSTMIAIPWPTPMHMVHSA